MATKKIDSKKTLAYAVAFHFNTSGVTSFLMGKTMYQHINTVYDQRSDNEAFNILEIVYNFSKMKYEVLVVSNDSVGSKEIRIL